MTITEIPLSSTEYTKLRGSHRTKWVVIQNPNTVVFAGRINQSIFTSGFAQFTYDGVSIGAYDDVKEGWTLYVSHFNDINSAYFRGRVRAVPTSSVMYLNQTDSAFADNDYFWVVKDTALHERLPRKSGDTLYWDYNRSYNQLPPTAPGLPHIVAARLETGGTVQFAFTPAPRPNTASASITGHSWDADGGTFVAGSSTSENVTIEFDAPGWYEVRYTPTDNGGRSSFHAVQVVVYPADHSSLVARALICDSIDLDPSTGWSAQIRANADDDLVEILDGTEMVVVSEDWFAEARGSLYTNIKFSGRLRGLSSQTAMQYGGGLVQITKTATVELEGIGAQLGRLILASVTLRSKASPVELGEIANLTLWRGMMFLASLLTTLTTTHPLKFDSVNDDYRYPLFTAQDRSAESSLSDIAFTINAFFNWSPDGGMKIARHMWYLNDTAKAALTTIANFDRRDYKSYTIKQDRVPRLGRVIAYGGTYNTSSNTTLALRAKAPALVWGPGEGRAQMNRQVLKANLTLAQAQAEMITRAGAEYASKNLVNTLETVHPSGYDNALSGSCNQRYTWTLTYDSNRQGFSCTTSKYWWLQRMRVRYTPFDPRTGIGGYTETSCTWVEDVEAVNAQIIAEIAPTDRPAPVPTMPVVLSTPFPGLPGMMYPNWPAAPDPEDEQPYTQSDGEAASTPPTKKSTDPEAPTPPPSADPASLQGQVVAVSNGGRLWICKDFALKSSPAWKDITPGSNITDFRFDPFSGGAYALTNDGSYSYLWRCDNVFNAAWRATTLTGVWTQVRPYKQLGRIAVFAPDIDPPDVVYSDFLQSEQGYGPFYGGAYATYIENEGWARGSFNLRIAVARSFTGTVTQVELTFNEAFTGYCDIFNASGGIIYDTFARSGSTWTISGLSITDGIGVNIYNNYGSGVFIVPETLRLVSIRVLVTTPEGASVAISTDSGGTFETYYAGDAVGEDVGFAVNGTRIYATTSGKIRESEGGSSFSDTIGGTTSGDALALWPYGSGVLMADSTGLALIDGASTSITPTDGSSSGTIIANNSLATGSSLILFVGTFGGNVKLARSSDGGITWDITTINVNSAATAVRAKNDQQVYLANGSSVGYSEDGGATLTLKAAPGAGLTILEVR